MWKLCSICYCLVLFCSTASNLGAATHAAPQQQQHHQHGRIRDHHPVYFDTIRNENEVHSGPVYHQERDPIVDYLYPEQDEVHDQRQRNEEHSVKSRNLVNSRFNQVEEDEQRTNELRGVKEFRASLEVPTNRTNSGSETQRELQEFMESFYLKALRIDLQKNTILHSFPRYDLPAHLRELRDNSTKTSVEQRSASSESRQRESLEPEDNDKEMIDFLRSSMEQLGPAISEETVATSKIQSEESATDNWLDYFRPIYRFIKDHMGRFEKEWNEHKRKLDRVMKQVQEERKGLEREALGFDGDDEPYDVQDFEHEMEQREIIFLDEVDCDDVFKGYYPTSAPTLKEYLDFCLQIDRNKFRRMVDGNHTDPLATNSVAHLPQLQIEKAELWFYKASPDAMDSHKQMFSLTAIDHWDVEGKFKKFETISLKQSPTAIGWISADISAPLVEWLSPIAFATLHRRRSHRHRNSANHKKRHSDAYYTWKKNFGKTSRNKFFLNVSCKTCMGTSKESQQQQQQGGKLLRRPTDDKFRPFFLIDFKRIDGTKHQRKTKATGMAEQRGRRDRRNINCVGNMKDCCRERLWINFADISMDFIIQPKGYYANFCRGSCKEIADMALMSSYSVQIFKYIKQKPNTAQLLGIKTCCSPSSFKTLTVHYINPKHEFSNLTLHNITAETCGCN